MEVRYVKRSFVIGVVWVAIIVGVLSFGATVFWIENLGSDNESNRIQYSDVSQPEEKNSAYITDQTAIRTNEYANLLESSETKLPQTVVRETVIGEKTAGEDSKQERAGEKFAEEQEPQSDIIETMSQHPTTWIKPVEGNVLRPFSPQDLIYSQTLQEWNVHVGTDYQAKLGDEVYAVYPGTIQEISWNEVYGKYLVIAHENGYQSLYANLTVLDALEVGSQVKQGEALGYVAESYGFEVAEESHLHFEMIRDGEYVAIP